MTPVRRLGKRHVEALLADYDRDPVGALTTALGVITGSSSQSLQDQLALCALPSDRTARLLAGDQVALDELVRELNELRTVPLALMIG